jgi:hypothetical protein
MLKASIRKFWRGIRGNEHIEVTHFPNSTEIASASRVLQVVELQHHAEGGVVLPHLGIAR